MLSSQVMAPLPVISNVYRTVLEWTPASGGQPVNVLHFRGSPGSAAGLYTAIDANVTATMWILSSTLTWVNRVVITPLDGSTASLINTPPVVAKWGGGASGQYIPAATAVLSMRTAKRGPSYRGRLYLPWLPESQQIDGTINPTDLATCQAAWVTFRTAVAAAGYTLVVASYKLATAELVTSTSIASRYGIQRKRQSA